MEHIPNKFVFEEGSHALDPIQGTKVNWGTFATVINDQIIENNRDISSSEDKRLGTFFVKKNELNAEIFPEKVLKYLWMMLLKWKGNWYLIRGLARLNK